MGARALVRMLLKPAGPNTRHILTVGAGSRTMSTAVEVDSNGELHYELPEVLRTLGALLGNGTPVSLVLRTFGEEIAFTAPSGAAIPVKTVRSWFVANDVAHPQSEAATFAAFCTDADSGEPTPPERGVRYAAAWDVQLA